MKSENTETYVGIDVSRKHLDVFASDTKRAWRVANEAQKITELTEELAALKPERIVLEATGGLEFGALAAMAAQGLPVTAVNPRQVRDFARSTGQLAKTDRLDSRVLAHYAQAIRPPLRPVPDRQAMVLKELVARRSQLVGMRVMENNRRKSAVPELHDEIDEHIAYLKQRIARVDRELDRRVRECPAWREKELLLRTAPGVGPVVARTLIASMPELGKISRKETAKLAGVAPLACDSGQMRGRRRVWGGRAPVRRQLYMAVLTAAFREGTIKSYYDRLIERGKPPKVALTACMRKLLTILNAMARDQKPWRPPIQT